MVVIICALAAVLTAVHLVRAADGMTYIVGALLVASVGAIDDLKALPAFVRLVAHFAAAIIAVVGIGGLHTIGTGEHVVTLGVSGDFLAVVGIVWLTNLYNFMDGIDGIAGTQAVVTGIGGAIVLSIAGAPVPAMLSLVTGAAAGGFLTQNWPPARMFMGDVGSGFLGFTFGVIGLMGRGTDAIPTLLYLLTLLPFLLDATVTLIVRCVEGQSPIKAHRSHVYQRLVQAGFSHRTVTVAYGAMALVGWAAALATVACSLNVVIVWGVFLMLSIFVYAGTIMWTKNVGSSRA